MPRKLKINFLLYSPAIGGGDRVIAVYAKHLKSAGHEVVITALRKKRAPWSRRLKRLLRTGQNIRDNFTTVLFDEAGVDVNVVAGKTRLENDDVPDGDILIATYWLTAEWALQLASAKGAKTYFIQGYEAHFPYAPTNRVNETYKAPLNKIVISKWLDALMRDNFPPAPIARIPNGVDTVQFHAPPRQKNKTPCVGFLYSGSSNKGVDVTTRAIEVMRREIPNLKVISFGAYHPKRELPLPPDCEFHFRPAQDAIRDLYAKCDVWLCGSRLEGFHLPPMEAMACRCPVVSTKVGGPEDVIEKGVQGFLVDKDNPEALAEKALFVLNLSDADWRRMSDAAYETATRYTWDDAGALFEKALYDIASAEGRVSS